MQQLFSNSKQYAQLKFSRKGKTFTPAVCMRLPQTAPQESGFPLRKGCTGTSASVWLPTLPVFCQAAGVRPGLINSMVDWEDPEMK